MLEAKLAEHDFKKELILYFKSIGGSNKVENIKNVTRALYTDDILECITSLGKEPTKKEA